MPTPIPGTYSRAEIEAEMRRRGLPIPGTYSRAEIEQEMQRRGMAVPEGTATTPLPAQAATQDQMPPLQASDILPQPGPQAPRQPGVVGQLGPYVKSMPGFEAMRSGAQSIVENVPGMQQAQSLADTGVNLMGGDEGGTINLAEAAGRGLGFVGGGYLGGLVAGPPGAVKGAMIGQGVLGPAFAGGALYFDRLARGEPVTSGDIAWEVGSSSLPDALTYGVKKGWGLAKSVATKTAAGVRESRSLAGKYLREAPEKLIKPPLEEDVTKLWDIVHASGEKLNPVSMHVGLRSIPDKGWDDAMRLVRNMKNPKGEDILGWGEAAADLMTKIRDGKIKSGGLPLGDLENLRRQVRNLKLDTKETQLWDALNRFQNTIDDAMGNPKNYKNGVNGDYQTLLKARDGTRLLKETEEVAELMMQVTSAADVEGGLKVGLTKLVDILDNPRTIQQKDAVRALDRRGGIKELREFIDNMGNITITPGAIAAATGSLGQVITLTGGGAVSLASGEWKSSMTIPALLLLANVFGAPASRAQFNSLILKQQARTGSKTMTLPMLMTLANAARRGTLQDYEQQPAIPNMVQ